MTSQYNTLPLKHYINHHSGPPKNYINSSTEAGEKHNARSYTATIPTESTQDPSKAASSKKLRKIRNYVRGTLITLNLPYFLLYHYHDCNTPCLAPIEDTLHNEPLSKYTQNPDINHQTETRGPSNA